MNKKQIAIVWGFQIALYLLNIILACIKGATLPTCIFGWACAIVLAGFVIYLQFNEIKKDKTIHDINNAFIEAIKEWKNLIDKEKEENTQLKAEIERLDDLNEKYPYHYSEDYMLNNKKLKEENERLKADNKKLKEILKGETVVIDIDLAEPNNEIDTKTGENNSND